MVKAIIITFLAALAIFVLFAILTYFYRKTKYYKKQVERSLKMIPFLVSVPKESGQDMLEGNRDKREVAREIISNAENMYNTLFSIYKSNSIKKFFYNYFYKNRHIGFELVAYKKEIYFYIAVPAVLVSLVEKAVTTHYPDAMIKEVGEHNIFSPEREMKGVIAAEVFGHKPFYYPMKTYQSIEGDSIEAVTNALSMLDEDEGVAIQILIRPTDPKRMISGKKTAQKIQKGPQDNTNALADFAKDIAKPGSSQEQKPKEPYRMTPEEEELARDIDRKATKFGYEARIRVIVSAGDDHKAKMIYDQIKGAFGHFSDLSQNGFKFKKADNLRNKERIVTDYIFRFFNDSLLGFERFFPGKRGEIDCSFQKVTI